MSTDLFKTDDQVTWSRSGNRRRKLLKIVYSGPFTIHTVRNVPKDICVRCGKPLDIYHRDFYPCPFPRNGGTENDTLQTLEEAVGHPQWVTVTDLTSSPLTGEDDERVVGPKKPSEFSGKYFRRM